MNIQDKTYSRTPADIEKKYNLLNLLALSKNLEVQAESIIKVNNEINNILTSLIINLGDILDTQSDISLWFYEGIPTKENDPYINWSSVSEHLGDLYYDQNTGYVYKYLENGWILQDDLNLINALALTNAELDVSLDHERKVYFSKPVPPYSSGDWWVLEDGTLKICQLGKDNTGEYEENDFIVSSKYTSTIATRQNETITVLQGTVTEITENYVKYTDLSTGGSTTIAGENVTTGSIKSSNYVQGQSGTKIDLNNGTIDTKNVSIDDDGLKLANGAKVVGSNGLKNTYLFNSNSGGSFCGYDAAGYGISSNTKKGVVIELSIPKGLEITSAKMHVYHNPVFWSTITESTPIGYCRNLKIYKANNMNSRQITAYSGSEMYNSDSATYDVISTTWYDKDGNSKGYGFTAKTPSTSSYKCEEIISADISDSFKNNKKTVDGIYQFKVESGDDVNSLWTEDQCCERTGMIYLIFEIEGYMTYQ